MNRLEKLASKNRIKHTLILSFLQDFGEISDNCYELNQVANEKHAHKFIIKNYEKFKIWQRRM